MTRTSRITGVNQIQNHDSESWITSRGDSTIQKWFCVPTILDAILVRRITSWITRWIKSESKLNHHLWLSLFSLIHLSIFALVPSVERLRQVSQIPDILCRSHQSDLNRKCRSWLPSEFRLTFYLSRSKTKKALVCIYNGNERSSRSETSQKYNLGCLKAF